MCAVCLYMFVSVHVCACACLCLCMFVSMHVCMRACAICSVWHCSVSKCKQMSFAGTVQLRAPESPY